MNQHCNVRIVLRTGKKVVRRSKEIPPDILTQSVWLMVLAVTSKAHIMDALWKHMHQHSPTGHPCMEAKEGIK